MSSELAPRVGTKGIAEATIPLAGLGVGALLGLVAGRSMVATSLVGGGVGALYGGLKMRSRGVEIVESESVFVPEIEGTPRALKTYGTGLAVIGGVGLALGAYLTWKDFT